MPTLAFEEYQIRTGDSFKHAAHVEKPFGVLDDILDWCRASLEHEWRWQLLTASSDQLPGRYIFYFDSDRDCCAFRLRWG